MDSISRTARPYQSLGTNPFGPAGPGPPLGLSQAAALAPQAPASPATPERAGVLCEPANPWPPAPPGPPLAAGPSKPARAGRGPAALALVRPFASRPDRTSYDLPRSGQDDALGGSRSHVPGWPGLGVTGETSPAEDLDKPFRTNRYAHPSKPCQPRLLAPLPDPSDCGGKLFRSLFCAACGCEIPINITCGDRCCPTCRRKAVKRLRARYEPMLRWLRPEELALLTLTLRIRPGMNLRAQDDLIRRSIAKLLSQAQVKRCVAGGFYSVEDKLGKAPDGSRWWNVHGHVLVLAHHPVSRWMGKDGRFHADLHDGKGGKIRPRDLGKRWAAITGGSHVVDLIPVSDKAGAVNEVLKYLSKGIGLPVAGPWRAEYNDVCKGRRLVQPFGCFHSSAKAYEFDEEDAAWADRPKLTCPSCAGKVFMTEFELRRLAWVASKSPRWKPPRPPRPEKPSREPQDAL